MEHLEILSPGKKIRNIRKKLGIKQYEITGGEITRNLISIIENDKATLTKNVAKIIADNINKACDEKEIDFHISYLYLMESEKDQAIKIVDKYIEKTSVDNFNDLQKLERFISTYDVGNRKSIVYERIADYYRSINDFYKSYTYYIRAYESSAKEMNHYNVKLLLKLSSICRIFAKYEEALEYNNLINIDDSILEMDLSFEVYQDRIDLFMLLEKYEMALAEIEYLEDKYEDIPAEIYQVLIDTKAKCFVKSKRYSEALAIQHNLLENDNSTYDILAIKRNLLEIYMLLRDNRNTRRIINECLELLSNPKEQYKQQKYINIFYSVAAAASSIGELDLGKEYYMHCINASKKNKDIEMLLKGLESLFDIYSKENNIEEIDSLKNEMIEIISMRAETKGHVLVFKILSFYNMINDQDTISGFLSFVLE